MNKIILSALSVLMLAACGCGHNDRGNCAADRCGDHRAEVCEEHRNCDGDFKEDGDRCRTGRHHRNDCDERDRCRTICDEEHNGRDCDRNGDCETECKTEHCR